ncbi:DUF1906 domain-containing protein [Streptomyces sp. NPDC026673]|uniref:DUF1906 domain-containing protein n=1 Tax=Streptomyces sp. NPDC026673 TaxID=3155724 RepID=UPI0033D51AA2
MREHKPIIRHGAIVAMVLACLLAGPTAAEAVVTRTTASVAKPPAVTASTPSAGRVHRPARAPGDGGDDPYGFADSGLLDGLDLPYGLGGGEERAPAGGAPTRVYRGYGFDTCRTPPLSTMRAWLRSKYRAIGVYYGGRARACRTQRHLNRNWVRSVHRMGWRILPIYVGSQSPCARGGHLRHHRIDTDDPWGQGASEGYDAVRRAAALGFAEGSALYLDMEAYNVRRSRCAAQTLDFIRAWDREVADAGYLPGLYSSSESGIRHIERARRQGYDDLPRAVWFARWQGKPSVRNEPVLRRNAWHPHGRIHQYSGSVREKHGGRRLAIDRNRLDGPVAVVE